jgi:hypothetical protein
LDITQTSGLTQAFPARKNDMGLIVSE